MTDHDPIDERTAMNPADGDAFSFEPTDLDGHTIDELADYLERGRSPRDASIDSSASCQIALAALARLRDISVDLLEKDALVEAPRDDSWISSILTGIGLEARAGRDIPFHAPGPAADLSVTEAAVRGLIRSAGDSVGGFLIGRVVLDGDVTVLGDPIRVVLDASILFGQSIPEATARLREAINTALLRHTELAVTAIEVRIHDIQLPPVSQPTERALPSRATDPEIDR